MTRFRTSDPRVALAAILVLAAVATAASTRLGQVMTIVVCAGVLFGSMLSNYFIGRHAGLRRARRPHAGGETAAPRRRVLGVWEAMSVMPRKMLRSCSQCGRSCKEEFEIYGSHKN